MLDSCHCDKEQFNQFSVIIDDSYSDLQAISAFYMHIKYMIARLLILDLCCLEGYV